MSDPRYRPATIRDALWLAGMAILFSIIVVCSSSIPTPATAWELTETRDGQTVVRLTVPEKSWLDAGPYPLARDQPAVGVIERPAGMIWHPGAIHLGGR